MYVAYNFYFWSDHYLTLPIFFILIYHFLCSHHHGNNALKTQWSTYWILANFIEIIFYFYKTALTNSSLHKHYAPLTIIAHRFKITAPPTAGTVWRLGLLHGADLLVEHSGRVNTTYSTKTKQPMIFSDHLYLLHLSGGKSEQAGHLFVKI